MNLLRLLSVALAVTAGVLVLSGSLGFTSTTADRGVSVAVADDSEAFVGYEATDVRGVEAGDTIEIIEITNRFNQKIKRIDVTLEENGAIRLNDSSTPDEIDPGSTATIDATVGSCPGTSGVVTTEVTVQGDSVTATLFDGESSETVERSFRVHCAPEDDEDEEENENEEDDEGSEDGEEEESEDEEEERGDGEANSAEKDGNGESAENGQNKRDKRGGASESHGSNNGSSKSNTTSND